MSRIKPDIGVSERYVDDAEQVVAHHRALIKRLRAARQDSFVADLFLENMLGLLKILRKQAARFAKE